MTTIMPFSSYQEFSEIPSVASISSIESQSSIEEDVASMSASISMSSPRSPPRRIFNSYWSSSSSVSPSSPAAYASPTSVDAFHIAEKGRDEPHLQDTKSCEATELLLLPELPFGGFDQSSEGNNEKSEDQSHNDDSTTMYTSASPNNNVNRMNSARLSRRQILPTPPPQVSPRLPAFVNQTHSLDTHRPWSSTSSLHKKPTRSCLRRSRYSVSCDGKDASAISTATTTAVAAAATTTKSTTKSASTEALSVSFHTQVSVFEFVTSSSTLEQRSKYGWSSYFA